MPARDPILDIRDLSVEVEGHQVLGGVNLAVEEGETHVLLGPNGGGKTTLLNTIMGLPAYRVTSGTILFRGHDVSALSVDERARLGIGMAFQRPPAVRGIKLRALVEVASGGTISPERVSELEGSLTLRKLMDRDVNMGFSGGEMKRSEMAQLLAQEPALALLDEPESGVDLDNIAVVGEAINALLKPKKAVETGRAGIIVTHTGHILGYVHADAGHVLLHGQLACSGNPLDLIDEISQVGYDMCAECQRCEP